MLSALEQPGAERACVEMADAYPRSETEHEAEAGEALLDSELASQAQQGAFRREAKAGPQVLGVSDKLPSAPLCMKSSFQRTLYRTQVSNTRLLLCRTLASPCSGHTGDASPDGFWLGCSRVCFQLGGDI